MTYRDPGEQGRGSRMKAPAAPSAQVDAFDAPHEGQKRKAAALANHEEGHEDRLEYLRTKLRELYEQRARAYHDMQRKPMPYVTADDADTILRAAGNLGYLDDGDDAKPRTWFGALFKAKGWTVCNPPGFVPSLRPDMNARMLRCWKWVGGAP